jgi:hypothetical protein
MTTLTLLNEFGASTVVSPKTYAQATEGKGKVTLFVTRKCIRCGGHGGWKGWPGFTCYRCGGNGTDPKDEKLNLFTPEAYAKHVVRQEKAAVRKEEKRLQKWQETKSRQVSLLDQLPEAVRKVFVLELKLTIENNGIIFGDAENTHSHSLLRNLIDNYFKFGSMSEKQLALVEKIGNDLVSSRVVKQAANWMPEGKSEITFTVSFTKSFQGQFGPSALVKGMTESGNIVQRGDVVSGRFTVENTEYNGTKENRLSRPSKVTIAEKVDETVV